MRTYGTAWLERGSWCIDCEAHVRLRMKRVFERLLKAQHGTLRISDTLENAYELAWFFKRYPMKNRDQDKLDYQVALYERRAALIAEVLGDPSYEPPEFSLATPARAYQRTAADLLLKNGHLLLADDVGLGKTAAAICTFTDARTLPALVVTLTHLPRQWQRELAKFAPTLRTHVLKRGKPYDLTRGYGGRVEPYPDVIITNYHKLRGWADVLAGVVRSVTFDECQELRRAINNGSPTEKYAAAEYIAHRANFRLGLSATPIYNYGGEFYNVLSVLAPGSLGTKGEFEREWCTIGVGEKSRIKEPKAFGAYVREQGLMLRRTRAEVGRELPPLTKVPHEIDADLSALDRVGPDLAELAHTILSQHGIAKGDRLRMASELDWRLRQATGMAKAPYVAQFVRLLVESGEQVVLYGWHHDVYAIWHEQLRDVSVVFYTGKQSDSGKEAAKQAFVSGRAKVLVMSLRAGAGLDGLQGIGRTIVFGELDWSPGVHEQCMGRVHRDGQTDPVVAYFLVANCGSDPVVADALGIKAEQIEGVVDPDAELVTRVDRGGHHIRRLAENFLKQQGVALPSAGGWERDERTDSGAGARTTVRAQPQQELDL